LPVQTLSVIPGRSVELGPIPFNLYSSAPGDKVVLFCRQGFEITLRHKRALDRADRVFFITRDNLEHYYDYASERLERIVENPNISTNKKVEIVRGVGMRVVNKLMEEPRSKEAMKRSGRFVSTNVNLVLSAPEITNQLFALSSAEGYALAHSVNVCTFCLLLGMRILGKSRKQLYLLGLGGLIHDVGLTLIDKTIFSKKDKLKEEEWDQMRTHPLLSFEVARDQGLPEPVQAVCRSHHERADGSGYPEGLIGREIHPFARIAAVADSYDAMTSDRSYHSSKPHIEALGEMARLQHRFDHEVFRALLWIVLHNDKLVEEFLKDRTVLTKGRVGQPEKARVKRRGEGERLG
jgi:HD-GYP domain-containing protein (c-di-GMP phosphodiesterase class II)